MEDNENRMNLLFICERNIMRSPTAAQVYSGDKHFRSRSAGLNSESKVVLTSKLLKWADRIFVMDDDIAEVVYSKFRSEMRYRELIILDIPDNYHYIKSSNDSFHDRISPIISSNFLSS